MPSLTIDELVVLINAETKDFKRQIAAINDQLDGMDKQTKKTSDGLAKMGKSASVVFAATGVAVAAGIGMAVKSFANYEQLVGGVETLFKSSSDEVLKYANGAYKTAGLSANRYMETVTSFSASLLQGLGGDTQAAVKYADMAVTDMSDNANKMGTNIGMIQDAYQGFAKDNFTMLDNLKLGYGGTAGEMARLVNDSGVLNGEFEATAENVKDIPFDKLIQAIHKTQDAMGIAGTTSKEASETISGSWNAVKASFENVLTGVEGSGKALSESMLILFSQLAEKVPPIVVNMITGMFEAIRTAITEQFGEGAWAVVSTVTVIIGTLVTILTAYHAITQLATIAQAIFNAVMAANPIGLVIVAVAALVAGLVYFFTQTETGRKVLAAFFDFMNTAFEWLRNTAESVWNAITGFFTDAWNAIKGVWGVAVAWFGSVYGGIFGFFSRIPAIVNFFSNAWSAVAGIWGGVAGWFGGKISAILSFFSDIPGKIKGYFDNAVNAVKNINWVQLGKDIVSGIANGLSPDKVVQKMKDLASKALDAVKSFLGIKSPSRVMRDQVGKMMGAGLAVGIDASTKDAVKSASNSAKKVFGAYSGMSVPSLPSHGQLGANIGVNSSAMSGMSGRQTPVILQLADGSTLANFVIDHINNTAFMSNGTPLNI